MKRHGIIWGVAVCFVVLLAGNFREIAAPPFWDDLMGFHRQALFLADHGFDPAALAASGDFWSGGARIYRWPHLPSWLYGAGYFCLPPVAVRCLGHLLNLALLAVAAGMMAQLTGKKRWLWAAAALANPLLMNQMASLGQEPWLVLAFMGVVAAVWRDCWPLAWGWLIFGVLVKPVMVAPAAALAAYGGWQFLLRRDRKRLLRMTGSVLLLSLFVMLLLGDSDGSVQQHRLQMAFWRAVEHFGWYFPLLGAVLLAAAGWSVIRWRLWHGRRGQRLLFLWLLQGAFWGCYVFYSVPLPRYAGAVVMPLYLLLAKNLNGQWRVSRVAAMLLLGGGLMMGAGYWQLPLPRHLTASGEFLERSRESVRQLRTDLRLCREIETRFGNGPVVAKWPYVMMLAEPRFGYVSRPVTDLRCAGILPRDLPGVKAYDPLRPPANALYIWAWNSFEFFSEFGPPIACDENDEIIWREPGVPVWLYRRKP